MAKSNSNMSDKIPMAHMEFNPYLLNWVETSPKPSPTLPVALRLHEETYVHLHVQRQ